MATVINPDYLTLDDIRGICVDLLTRLSEYRDPQPDPSPREPHILSTILEQPKQTCDGEDLYPTTEERAACSGCSTMQSNPQQGGMAGRMTSLLLL